jgi:hypothetical protein
MFDKLKQRMNGGEKVLVVWSREHHVEIVPCMIDHELRLVRSEGQAWPKPEFDAKPIGKDHAYLALGEKIVPWPTREKPAYDVKDDGTRIEITPEYLDRLTRDTDTEAWLRGVRGITMAERLVHLAAGAAIGMVLTFFMLKLIGFVGAKGGASGTTVTITNATSAMTNSTHLAMIALPHALHVASFALWGWFA